MNPFNSTSAIIFFLLGAFLQGIAQSPNLDAEAFKFTKVDHSSTMWYLEMGKLKPNILKAEAQFIAYFQDHNKESSKQKKLFTRWLQSAKLSMNGNGFYIPHQWSPTKNKEESSSTGDSGSWRMTGPNYAERTACGTSSSLSGGFCDRVYINPKNTNNLFAGYSYGGLWVSQDQGESWNLSDAAFSNGTNTYANRDYYYGEIEASGVDPTIVYAATESGLLKSLDNGIEWTMCPELNRTVAPNLRPYYIALSTTEDSRILSTFGRKLYLSIDGGDTWQVAFDNESGGNNHHYTSQYSNNSTFGIYDRTYNFFGVEPDHDDPNTFYLGVWNADNEPCIYKSTDKGVSFSFLVNLNTKLDRSLPANLLFQTIPAQPDRFYIYPQFVQGDSLYRFNELGNLISKNQVGTNYIEAGDINWLDENSVYAGFYFASSVMKSTDGAISFEDQTDGYSGCPKYVHPDVRGLDAVGDIVLIGSDGGIAISTDGMNTVSSDIGREISSIDLWGFSSSPKSDIIAAGCDHGPTKIRRFDGDNGWISRGGGDAGQVSVNQSNDRWIYFNHGYGIFKTELDQNNEFVFTEGINPGVSLHRVEFHPNLYQVAYGINGTEVRISRDNFSSFKLFYDFGQTVNVFKTAQQDSAVMYTLLGNSSIQRSSDGGMNWTVITPPSSISGGQSNIVDITVGDNPLEIWAAYGNWQNTAKVLKSTDGGDSWTNITSSNLPLTPISQTIYQRGTQGGVYIAFAGQSGVWYRNNIMEQWEPLGNGIASMGYVQNIYTVPAKGKYRMGSSRGSWEHDLYEESTSPIASFAVNSNISTCPAVPIEFIQNCSHSSGIASYHWTFPGGYPSISTDANPLVRYYSPGQYDVGLTVIDAFGNSNTQTLNNFITVKSDCDDSDFDGIDDLDEITDCDQFLPDDISVTGLSDSILITDFDGISEGQYYININIQSSCDNATAVLQAFIHLDDQEINVTSYQHFASSASNDPIVGSGTNNISSQFTNIAQLQVKLIGSELFLFQLSNACSDMESMEISNSCWTNIDSDGDGILNYLDNDSDNDGLMDLIENMPCYSTIPESEKITGNEAVNITNFEENNSGIYFLDLKIISDCSADIARLQAFYNLDEERIDVFSYHHFGSSNETDQINGDGTNEVVSFSTEFAQFKIKLDGNALSLQQLSSSCNGEIQLLSSCFSSLDMDGDGILNYLDLDSDGDGLSDQSEAIFCDQEVGISNWFSAGDSVLVADFTSSFSTINLFYMDLNAYTNCYNLNANMKVFVNIEEQKIDVLSYQHFNSTNNDDPVVGSGTNMITAQASSFATIRYKLIGNLLYLHQVSNACGSVLRRNNSCWNQLDLCAIDIPDYLSPINTTTFASICVGDSYTFPDGTVQDSILESLDYTSIIQTSTNCDSTVITHLQVIVVNTSVNQDGVLLSSNAEGSSYQWVDCANENTPIVGETNQTYTPGISGAYAVIVTENNCSAMSACYTVIISNVVENTFENEVRLYPNPADGFIFLELNEFYNDINVEITSLDGRTKLRKNYLNKKILDFDIKELTSGEYFIIVTASDKRAVLKFIKK